MPGTFDVFFSYHTVDHAAVTQIARRLHDRGIRVFLDRWYLAAGQPWPPELERMLASCGAVAVFLGAEGLGPWQQRERDLALDRQGREPGFPVIPVLLTRADPPLGFLKLNTWVDLSAGAADEAALEILTAAIRRQPLGPLALQQIAAVLAGVCPYRGLWPFREEDESFFFGRAAFTETLATTLARRSFVAVVGASGSGKSSVVRAGLIPRLRRGEDGRIWEAVSFVPTDQPLHSLAKSLLQLLEPDLTEVDRLAEVGKLARHLAEGEVRLRDVTSRILEKQPGTERLLLFADQWEELYALCADETIRTAFVAQLLEVVRSAVVTVVLTLRGDFMGHALANRELSDRLQDSIVTIGPMTRNELAEAITKPAEKMALAFEPGLVETILDDVGAPLCAAEGQEGLKIGGHEPGSLPLLEFLLEALWKKRRGALLYYDAYHRLGRVSGAIAHRAEEVFERGLTDAERQVAQRLLIRMVRPGEGVEDTRQRAAMPEADPVAEATIHKLADARLVVTEWDAASGRETVEMAHEALIRGWQRLRGWVDQDREFLRTRERIAAQARLWEDEGKPPDRLLAPGRPLAEGRDLLATRRADLDADLITYVEASTTAAKAEEDAKRAIQHRRLRRARLLSAAMAFLALVAIGGGTIAWWQRGEANLNAKEAQRQTAIADLNAKEAQRQTAIADQRATDLTKALDEARANLIWSRLEFTEEFSNDLQPQEVDALWELASGGPSLREAFLKQLGNNRSLLLRLAKRPEPVIRAFGLRLSTEHTQVMLDTVLDAIKQTTDSGQLAPLLATLQALPVRLTPEQALRPLGQILDVLVSEPSMRFRSTGEPLLLEHVKILASIVKPEKAQVAVNAVVDVIKNANPSEIERPVQALQALPVQLTPEQAEAVAGRILDSVAERDSPLMSNRLFMSDRPQALEALPVQFTPERARLALGHILDTIGDTATWLSSLQHLARIAQAISLKLTAEQAKAEFDQQVLAAVSKRFLDAIRGTSDPEALQKLAEQVQKFPLQLTTKQMKAAVAYVLDIIRDNKDPNALYPLLEAVKVLPAQLTADQAQAVLGRFLDVIKHADIREDWRLSVAADALTSKLTADQAQAALSPILDAMRRETSLSELGALIRMVGKLAPYLTPDQALVALGRVLATISDIIILDTTIPDTRNAYRVLETTALSIEELVSKLATNKQQAKATFDHILTAIQSTRAPNGLRPLLHGLQRLAPHLTNDQAQAALASVLEHWRSRRPMSVGDFIDIAQTVSVLPIQLSAEQMQFALDRILHALPEWHTGRILQIQTIAGAIEAVAPKLTTDQSEAVLDAILHAMFSWSQGGWLGAGYQDAIGEMASAIAADEPRGIVVTQIASRSPAQSADIQAGDIITAFDGTTIDQATALTRLVGKAQPGKEVVVTVWRRGEKKDLTLTLGEKVMRLGEGVEDGMRLEALTAMADALKALPVPLSADQFQMVSRGFRKVTMQYGDQTLAPGAMAEVVEALAPKLTNAAKADMLSEMRSILTAGSGDTDVRWARAYEALLPPSSAEYYERAKADMLSALRSILGAVGSGDAAVRWAKVYESLLTPSPPEYYISSIAEVLKYPTSEIKKRHPSDDELRRNPEKYETLSATEYFRKKMSQKFQDAKELQSGKLMDLLDWVAKNYPEIDLVRPPIRPNLS